MCVCVQLALITWREVMFVNLDEAVTAAALNLIRRKKNGERINTHLIRKLMENYGGCCMEWGQWSSLLLVDCDLSLAVELEVQMEQLQAEFSQLQQLYVEL